jgi:hypothetical protein
MSGVNVEGLYSAQKADPITNAQLDAYLQANPLVAASILGGQSPSWVAGLRKTASNWQQPVLATSSSYPVGGFASFMSGRFPNTSAGPVSINNPFSGMSNAAIGRSFMGES